MLSFLMACGNPAPEQNPQQEDCLVSESLFNMQLVHSSTTSLWKVQWTGQAGDIVYYINGAGDEIATEGQRVEQQYEVFLWDIPPAVSSELYIERVGTDGHHCSETQTLENEALPSSFPEIEKKIAEVPFGYLATTITMEDTRFLTIFNGVGEVIWYYEVPYKTEKVPLSHINVLSDGVLFTENAPNSSSNGTISKIDWMGENLQEKSISGLNIGFAVVEDGHYLALTSKELTEGIDEDVLIEITASEQRELWRATDSFPLPDVEMRRESWVHSNYLYLDQEQNKLLMSMEFINSVGQMDLSTSSFDWLVSGLGGADLETSYHPSIVARPHSIHPYLDGYVLLNRGNLNTTEHNCANIGYFSVDEGIQLEQQIFFDPCVSLGFFGEATPLQDGFILGTWSDRGQINIYSPDGEAHWQLNLRLGAVFGFSDWFLTSP